MSGAGLETDPAQVRLVAEIVADIRADPALGAAVGPDTDLIADLGLDSLEIIDLLMRLEDELEREIDLESITRDTLRSVAALCRAAIGAG